MTRLVQALSAIVIFLHGANAQGVAWAQCGGIGWTGAKTCVSGNVCTYSNDYYSQCIPVTGGATTTTKAAATTTKAATTKATTTTTKSAAAGTPKVYVCGDSTAATWPATNALQGWAAFLQYSLKAIVVNKAISGRSARSFTVEGHFQEVANLAVKGDFVIIEFGHNDGGSLNPDNGRSDCPGAGSETCTTAAGLVVQTYPTYIINAAKLMIAKGAKVIFSSPTPNNPWESGTFSYASGRFSTYSKAAAVTVGSQASYVDHGQYTANIFKTLGAATTDSYFPNDHTHTNAAGATVVQRAFVKGLLCSNNFLAPWVKNSTTSVQGACI